MTSSTNTIPATLSGDSQQALLTWLQENPKTLGWDAIVVYNRGRANALLMQQYIKKLTADNYLTPIDGQIGGPEGSKLNFFGIQLGLPRLSFENADIEHSKARVTQAITAGLAILNSEPVGGYKGIHSIMRPNGAAGPTLWMDVDLLDAPGGVNDAGVVQIDLKKMTSFDTDLFSDPVSVINAREFFLERFREKPELQVYTLGVLNKEADSTLTPQNFIIRTQPAPGAKVRGAPNYGDGAVVMLVTLKGGTDGGAPTRNSDFRYLIPNDEDGTKYSSAVLLSNKVMFGKLVRNHVHSLLPGSTLDIKAPVADNGTVGHIYLEFSRGRVAKENFEYVGTGFFSHNVITVSTPLLEVSFEGGVFAPKAGSIEFAWMNRASTNSLHYHEYRGGFVPPQDNKDYDSNVSYIFNMISHSTPNVHPGNGTVEFSPFPFILEEIGIQQDYNPFWGNEFEGPFRAVVQDGLLQFVTQLTLPDIDTFLLRNLLFPDSNSMVLTDAHVPGDLAVFGNVDPSLTSFVIEPENAILNPASTRSFRVEPSATVTWSVTGLPGDSHPVGSINAQGVYTAPTRDEFEGRDALQVIITASGTTARGTTASSSTLVSIVSQTISLNPVFSVAGKDAELKFSAGSLDERPLHWALKDPGQGGSVTPATGKEIVYTAPAEGTDMFTLDVLQVTDDQGNMGQADVLVINKMLGGQVEVDLAQATQGKAQLRFMKEYDSGPIEVPSDRLTWTLLAGPGSVDAAGLYTEPQQQLPGFCVITCAFPRQPDFEGAPIPVDYGYTVLPLPLSQYPDMARAYR